MYFKKLNPTESEFWLDIDKYSKYIISDATEADSLIFDVDMIRLSSIRRSISNFVKILTRRNIPVYFNHDNKNFNEEGKLIYISPKITSRLDFDVAVGIALHEGAHSLKTDFDMVKISWANIPHSLWNLSDSKNIGRSTMEGFIHTIWNVIEDRYIDDYVFRSAPGYQGYYIALYDKFFHADSIGEYLQGDNFRFPSLESYKFRVINLTNTHTDLTALPELDTIAKIIDISNISRLHTTKLRIETAFTVVETILKCLGVHAFPIVKPKMNRLAKSTDFFDFEDSDTNANDDQKSSPIDVGEGAIEEISDVMSGKKIVPPNEDIIHKIANDEIDPKLKKLIDSQQQFLKENFSKETITDSQKILLDLIEKNGISLVRIDTPTLMVGNNSNFKLDCIVVNTLSRDLIMAGRSIFPLSCIQKSGMASQLPSEDMELAVANGIVLGTKLGRKLHVRSEINYYKEIRKKSGRINKRQLHEAVSDVETLFYKLYTEQYSKASLHISVDASSSMTGEKWHKTITSVVAICKATSMINNIHVTVSFRTTHQAGSTIMLPYVVLAYDSAVDKFSKVKSLFPYLVPNGCTPEGLAFSAIMGLFENVSADESERYFLNLSDGEPYYQLTLDGVNITYHGEIGVEHTRKQVDTIRRNNINILSYFISEIEINEESKNDFYKMYGQDSKFINVNNVVDLSKTINELFLKKL